jgi:hypothetical protein
MKKIISILVTILLFFLGCQYTNEDYKITRQICNELYLEVYRNTEGLFPTGLRGYVITDSIEFEQELFTIQEKHNSYFEICLQDYIIMGEVSLNDKNIVKSSTLQTRDKSYRLRKMKLYKIKLEIDTNQIYKNKLNSKEIYSDKSFVVREIILEHSIKRIIIEKYNEEIKYFDISIENEISVNKTDYFNAVIIYKEGVPINLRLF